MWTAVSIAAPVLVILGGLVIARSRRRSAPVPPPATSQRSAPSSPPEPDAFAFRSPLTMPQMKPLLEEATACPWWDGDSAWIGDYLGARIGPEARMLRLYEENAGFVLHVRRGPLTPDLRTLVLKTLLPLLQASDIATTEGFD